MDCKLCFKINYIISFKSTNEEACYKNFGYLFYLHFTVQCLLPNLTIPKCARINIKPMKGGRGLNFKANILFIVNVIE